MRRVVWGACIIACILAIPSAAHAQASIAGVVKDTSGAVLPGVTVEAASPALIEKTRSVVTANTGQYKIEDLRPGVYILTFTLTGFNTVKREGIELTGTFTATVNAELRVGSVEETVTVTGETPTVDLQATLRQQVMTHDVIDAIPFGRDGRDLSTLIPGVASTRQDVGGSATDISGSAAVHGSRANDQRITVGGLSMAVPFSGSSSSHGSNMAAYQEVTVDTASVDSEQATSGVRINYIPKDGGNAFSGSLLANFANESMQSSNYTQALKDRGLTTPNSVRKLFDINPGFGGPIKKDKLWFFFAARYNGSSQYPAGIFYNLNANNPNLWTYAPDTTRRPSNDSVWKDGTARLTWQANPKNKLGFGWSEQKSCYCPEVISATAAPETAINRSFTQMRNIMTDWTSPVTSRVLIQASAFRRMENPTRHIPDGTNPLMITVTDQGLGNLSYRAPLGQLRTVLDKTLFYRASVSYVSGSHALKVGFTGGNTSEAVLNFSGTQAYNYRFNNGVPNQITLNATPFGQEMDVDAVTGIFAQDKWTIARLTLSYGLRYDYFKTSFPEQVLGPGQLVPNRNVTLPASPGVKFQDIAPKSGAVYDLFGDGRTALKVSLSKYLEGLADQGILGSVMAPSNQLVTSTTRSWTDTNKNFIPDCNLLNPAAQTVVGGDVCGAMANQNFGTIVPGTSYDPAITTGWGKRGYNWEFSTGIQRELMPRVSAEVSYFRRWYGNFLVTDNLAVAASDYSTFSIPAPVDPRLPGGGGNVVSGLFDLNPAKFGVPSQNLVTAASKYGTQTEHWNGVDVTVNARPRSGLILTGGLDTGRTATNNCAVVQQIPEALFGATNLGDANANVWLPASSCQPVSNWLTQVKFIGTYTVPRIDVQLSGTLQSNPGPQIAANYIATNALVAPSLGRNLSGNAANVTVNVIQPGTLYGDRLNQLDIRVAKIFQFGRTRAVAGVDVYNVFNSNAVLTQNNAFATWQAPQSILLARFAKVGMQLTF